MKKFLLWTAGTLAVLVLGIYVFRVQIFHALEGPITANMFVSQDTDGYDPGLPVGARFPAIRALYQGREITTIDQFMGARGAIFIASRSADW